LAALAASINTGNQTLIKQMLKAARNGKAKQELIAKNGMILGTVGDEALSAETKDGSMSIVFVGAIYNSETLRPLIKPAPNGKSVADIVLGLYKMKGAQCVHYLDGPFAFVIADGDKFYAARDPLGVKPLYFSKDDKGWIFSTDLKAFKDDVKNVTEFPAGCYVDGDSARRYYKLPEAPVKNVNLNEAVDLIRTLVTESVTKRIEPHGEVGIYLTGSVESCIVAALAAEKVKKIKTFSVGLEGSIDGNTAKRVASWLSTDHTHVEISQQEMLDCLPEVVSTIESFDANLVRQGVADYFAVRAASGKVKALIGADGANELFGGYAYLRPMFSEKLTSEIRHITEDLHRTNLHRWERMTSVAGIEGRMPYVDRKLVHAAFHLPANMKINEEGRSKWILRRTFSTLLPAWVIDRPDNDDTHHQGIITALEEYAATVFTDDDLSNDDMKSEPLSIRTKDELLYYQIWSTKFPVDYVHLVGRTQI
jgi:asparagine synthase (glutamine-hydrolysing)